MSRYKLEPEVRPSHFRWVVFGLGCGTSFTLYLHRYTFALIKPTLAEEWNVSNTELGLLDSTFSLFYTAFQVPSGVLADLFGAHYFLTGIVLLWSILLALHAWAPDMAAMRYVRAGFGTAQAGAYATLSRVTRNWFPSTVRTTAQGWIGVFSGRMGAALSNLIFAALLMGVLGLGWRSAIYLFASAGIALAGAIFILLRDSPRGHPWVNEAEADLIEEVSQGTDKPEAISDGPTPKPPRPSMLRMMARMRPRPLVNLFALNLQSTLSTIADQIYSTWIPMFLVAVHQLKFKEMGVFSSLPLLGGAFGGAAGGFLNDWLIRKTGSRRWSRTGVGFAGKALAGVVLLVALLYAYDSPYLFCGMLFLVKFFGDWSLSTGWGTVTDIGGRASATVFAFNNAVAAGLAIPAPPIYGYVADHYGWSPVFGIVTAIYLLCGASWLLIDCTIPLLPEEESVSG